MQNSDPVFYYKPVQTGFPEDSDADVVAGVCGGTTEFGDHACELLVCYSDTKFVVSHTISDEHSNRFQAMRSQVSQLFSRPRIVMLLPELNMRGLDQ